jgi:hypothetical protein
MYYAADKQKAQRVLDALRSIRAGESAATLASLQSLRNEVACERTSDLPRMQAWLSIRRLYDAFKGTADQELAPRDLGPQWQDAIARTTAWRESLR